MNHFQYTQSDISFQNKNADFSGFYDRHAPALFGFINRLIADGKIAELVLQKTFLLAEEERIKTDGKGKKEFLRLSYIARDLYLNHLAEFAKGEKTKIRKIDSLVDMRREQKTNSVLYKVYYKGLTINEIADELGIPTNTIKKRLRAELKQLRGVNAK